MIYVVYSCCCENMFLKKERQTIKKEKERYFLRKKLNIIEKKKSVIKYCIFSNNLCTKILKFQLP